MARKTSMTIPESKEIPLGNAPITVTVEEVDNDTKKVTKRLGRLQITKAKVTWLPRNAQGQAGVGIGWGEFIKMMEEKIDEKSKK